MKCSEEVIGTSQSLDRYHQDNNKHLQEVVYRDLEKEFVAKPKHEALNSLYRPHNYLWEDWQSGDIAAKTEVFI